VNVVVDTNVLVSGIFWGGKPDQLLEKWRDDAFVLVVTPDILDEYLRVLAELASKQPELSEEWADLLLEHARIVEQTVQVERSRDPDDDKFLGCALSAMVDCIVSGDADLLALGNVDEIPILTAARFLSDWPHT
jgi:putative PIN family toxin of toxin-antitoxin system